MTNLRNNEMTPSKGQTCFLSQANVTWWWSCPGTDPADPSSSLGKYDHYLGTKLDSSFQSRNLAWEIVNINAKPGKSENIVHFGFLHYYSHYRCKTVRPKYVECWRYKQIWLEINVNQMSNNSCLALHSVIGAGSLRTWASLHAQTIQVRIYRLIKISHNCY